MERKGLENYYVGSWDRLREIFTDHCAMTGEEYEEISGRFINLECEYADEGMTEDAERLDAELRVIFEFLYNTKRVTVKEYTELCNLVTEMESKAIEMAGERGL